MSILCNNLGLGGSFDQLFGQTGSLTKTYTLPASGAAFIAHTNLERFDAFGLAADPFDNWGSYTLVSPNGAGATSATRSTAGCGRVCSGAGDTMDNDLRDLRNAGNITVVQSASLTDAGPLRSTVTLQNGSVLNFEGIETILCGNGGVNRTDAAQSMSAGFTDAEGDQIDGNVKLMGMML